MNEQNSAKAWFDPFDEARCTGRETPMRNAHKIAQNSQSYSLITLTLPRLLSISSILIVICASCYTPQSKDTIQMSSTKNGIQFKVAIPAAVQTGEEIGMVVKLTNPTAQTIYYGERSGVRELGIRVRDSKQASPELTALGKINIGEDGSRNMSFYRIEALDPGQSHEWHVDLNALFKFTPGTYLVSTSIKLNDQLDPFVISVDGVKLRIK
jgi:hypothetical protein